MQNRELKHLPPDFLQYELAPLIGLADINSLSKDGNTLFGKTLNQCKAIRLFHGIREENYSEAEKLMNDNLSLMLQPIRFNILNGGYEWTTPLKEAFKRLDTPMWTMYFNKIKNDVGYVRLFNQQARDTNQHVSFEYIFTAYKTFDNQYSLWEKHQITDEELKTSWLDLGKKQAIFPKHLLNEFFREGGSWDLTSTFDEKNILPECEVYNFCVKKYTAWNCGLGEVFTLYRGDWHSGKGCNIWARGIVDENVDKAWVEDLEIFRHLCTVRMKEFEEMKNPKPIAKSFCNIL
jgi:hypothetical protein